MTLFNRRMAMKIQIINKKLLLTLLFIGALLIPPWGSANATPDQAIVGSWCITATRHNDPKYTPVLWNINADGNITAVAPYVGFNANKTPGSPPPYPVVRLPAIGEVTKVGDNEWETNYQYFEVSPTTGALLSKSVFKNPITYDKDLDQIMSPAGKVTSGARFFFNGVTPNPFI